MNNQGLIGSLLGTVKTDNTIGFDTPSLLRAGGIAIVSGVIIGLAVKGLAKLFNL